MRSPSGKIIACILIVLSGTFPASGNVDFHSIEDWEHGRFILSNNAGSDVLLGFIPILDAFNRQFFHDTAFFEIYFWESATIGTRRKYSHFSVNAGEFEMPKRILKWNKGRLSIYKDYPRNERKKMLRLFVSLDNLDFYRWIKLLYYAGKNFGSVAKSPKEIFDVGPYYTGTDACLPRTTVSNILARPMPELDSFFRQKFYEIPSRFHRDSIPLSYYYQHPYYYLYRINGQPRNTENIYYKELAGDTIGKTLFRFSRFRQIQKVGDSDYLIHFCDSARHFSLATEKMSAPFKVWRLIEADRLIPTGADRDKIRFELGSFIALYQGFYNRTDQRMYLDLSRLKHQDQVDFLWAMASEQEIFKDWSKRPRESKKSFSRFLPWLGAGLGIVGIAILMIFRTGAARKYKK